MARNEVKVSFVGDDRSLGSTAKKVGQELGTLDNTLKGKLVGSLDSAGSKFGGLGKVADKTGVSLGGLVGSSGLATAAIGGALVAGIGSAVSAASNLNETVSATNQIFGSAAPQLLLYAESASAIGLSKNAALEAVNTFGDLFTAIGLTATESAARSKEFTDLAADLASFKNTSPEEAITALGAALRGESEPIRRYGVLLDDATLKQKALDMGLIKSTTGTLPPAIRAQAAYQLILDKTTNAQGDVERTSGSLANQTRRMQANFENVSAELGQNLIPYLVKAAEAANNFITGQGLLGVEYDKQSGLIGTLVKGLGQLTGGFYMAEKASEEHEKSLAEAQAQAQTLAEADALATKRNEDWSTAIEDTSAKLDDNAGSLQMSKDATAALAKAQEEATLRSREQLEALAGLDDQLHSNWSTLLGAEAAQIQTNQALAEYTKTTQGADQATDEARLALIDMTGQVLNTAEKTGEAAVAQGTFAREVDASAASIDAQIGYLQGVAGTLAPGSPLRAAIEGYINELNGIKSNITTEIDANTEQAMAKLRALQSYIQSISGGFDIPIGLNAAGGSASGLTLVGEEGAELVTSGGKAKLFGVGGPELANLPRGSFVYTAEETASIRAMADGGLVGGAPATRGPTAGGGTYPGKTLNELFGPGGQFFAKASQTDNPFEVLFGRGADFYNWMITGGKFVGQTLGGVFGPGSDFYRTGAGAEVLEMMFGRGADFSGIHAVDPKARYTIGDTGPSKVPAHAPAYMASPNFDPHAAAGLQAPSGVLPFGWWSDAYGLHSPSGGPDFPGPGSISPTYIPKGGSSTYDVAGLQNPTYIPPPFVGPGSNKMAGTTINIYTGANPQEVIEAIRKYERMNGTSWRN